MSYKNDHKNVIKRKYNNKQITNLHKWFMKMKKNKTLRIFHYYSYERFWRKYVPFLNKH